MAVIIVVGFSPNIEVPNRILGDVLILMGAFAYAVYLVTSRYFLNTTQNNLNSYQPSSIWIITWVSFFGLLMTTPIALIISPEFLNLLNYIIIPQQVWIVIANLAFLSTIGAYTFYLEGVKRLDESKAAIFQTLESLLGGILSAIFLREQFDVFIYSFTLLLGILGITLGNRDVSNNKEEKRIKIKKIVFLFKY